MQNNPNPFKQDTRIEMLLPEEVNYAEIQVYSMEGQLVEAIPVNTRGHTDVVINGGTLEDGIYIYALEADGQIISSKRMVLNK